MAEESLRDTLEAQYDNVEDPTPGESATPSDTPSNEPPVSGEPAGGEAPAMGDKPGGKEPPPVTLGEKTPPEGAPPKGDDVKAEGAAPTPAVGESKPGGAPSLKAPQSWKPEVREHWAKLPPEVQQEVVRREQQVMRALNEASRFVQHHNQFQELCAPYSSMIAMDGGNPLNTFKEYLQTAAVLRLGAPQEKAVAIANAIVQFGVDVQQLDGALAERFNGKAPTNGGGQQQPQFRDPRVDELLGTMESRRRERDDMLTRTQQAEIDSFVSSPEAEFFRDVQPMVADILEVYANQGVRCSLKEAYNKACMLHPEISKVVQARATAAEAAKLVKKNQSTIDAKRRAASNPPGSPNVGPEDNANSTLRDAISAAMTQAESRA